MKVNRKKCSTWVNRDGSARKRQRNRDIVNKYKDSHPCVACGESRVPCLDFHHLDGGDRVTISDLVNNHVSLKLLFSEMEKCIILCANCHRMIHSL